MGSLGVASWPYTVDDAFVTARYAERLLAGAGYTMRDGPPTDGVTGPLALVPAMIGELFGDAIGGAKITGLLCGMIAAFLAVRHAARRSVAQGALACALIASGPVLGVWSIAGLETGMAALAMTGAVLGMLERRPIVCGLSIGAIAWLRPELAPACLVVIVALALADRRAAWIAGSIAASFAIAIVIFRVAMFGTPIPLSAMAKPGDLAHGVEYLARGALIALGGGGVIAIAMQRERAITIVLGAHALAIVLAGGDWMPGFRLFAPLVPVYAIAASAAIVPLGKIRGAALFVACAAIPAVVTAIELPRIRDAGAARERQGARLAQLLRSYERVALVDVGYLVYASGVEPIDLGGITDPEIAMLPGEHLDKAIDESALRARRPDAIVLHSSAPPIVVDGELRALAGYPVEQRVARMGFVRRDFRVDRVVQYSSDYFYVVLRSR